MIYIEKNGQWSKSNNRLEMLWWIADSRMKLNRCKWLFELADFIFEQSYI